MSLLSRMAVLTLFRAHESPLNVVSEGRSIHWSHHSLSLRIVMVLAFLNELLLSLIDSNWGRSILISLHIHTRHWEWWYIIVAINTAFKGFKRREIWYRKGTTISSYLYTKFKRVKLRKVCIVYHSLYKYHSRRTLLHYGTLPDQNQ